MTAYSTTCPRCGSQLSPVAVGPETPPWLCRPCKTAWWVAELTPEARTSYRPHRHDFRPRKPITAAVTAEAQLAKVRGSSLRPEQVSLMPAKSLQVTAGTRITTDLATAIAAHLKGTP